VRIYLKLVVARVFSDSLDDNYYDYLPMLKKNSCHSTNYKPFRANILLAIAPGAFGSPFQPIISLHHSFFGVKDLPSFDTALSARRGLVERSDELSNPDCPDSRSFRSMS